MKGIIIYEAPLWGDEENVVYLQEVKDASYTLKQIGSDDITCYLEGIATKEPVTKATCNKDDTYDFEVGALIALMKMCGVEKVTKACDELYKDDNYKNALQEMTENNEKLMRENNYLKYVISCRESAIESLENTRDLLINKNNELISDKDKSWKNYQRKIQKKQDRINEVERAYKASNDDKAKLVEYYQREIKKLESENEKLQHGYNDINILFCGGRQNGKQYKSLVTLFKKLDQKKVDAAYKEAYNTTLPLWQKGVLKQMYGVYGEWIKPPTKREEMWENILGVSKCSSVEIKVAKDDITTFLRDLQDKIPEVRWNGSDCLPVELSVPDWFKHDYIYFALFRHDNKLKLCYSEKPHSWINKPVIEYIAPMRWDLFKKGRIAVKVTYKNYKEFCDACERELGKKPSTYLWDDVTISISKKDGNFEIFTIEHQKTTGKKIVNWEDVRDKTSSMEDPYDNWFK